MQTSKNIQSLVKWYHLSHENVRAPRVIQCKRGNHSIVEIIIFSKKQTGIIFRSKHLLHSRFFNYILPQFQILFLPTKIWKIYPQNLLWNTEFFLHYCPELPKRPKQKHYCPKMWLINQLYIKLGFIKNCKAKKLKGSSFSHFIQWK